MPRGERAAQLAHREHVAQVHLMRRDLRAEERGSSFVRRTIRSPGARPSLIASSSRSRPASSIIGQQVHPPGAAIHQLDVRGQAPTPAQPLERGEADAVVAHERVAEADDDGGPHALTHRRTSRSAGTNRPPLTIEEMVPVRSRMSARIAR